MKQKSELQKLAKKVDAAEKGKAIISAAELNRFWDLAIEERRKACECKRQ